MRPALPFLLTLSVLLAACAASPAAAPRGGELHGAEVAGSVAGCTTRALTTLSLARRESPLARARYVLRLSDSPRPELHLVQGSLRLPDGLGAIERALAQTSPAAPGYPRLLDQAVRLTLLRALYHGQSLHEAPDRGCVESWRVTRGHRDERTAWADRSGRYLTSLLDDFPAYEARDAMLLARADLELLLDPARATQPLDQLLAEHPERSLRREALRLRAELALLLGEPDITRHLANLLAAIAADSAAVGAH